MPKGLRASLAWIIATATGSGCIRPMSGTWGSLWAALVALLALVNTDPNWWLPLLAAMTLASCLAGWWACPWAIEHYGRSDPSQVVIDEVAGLWLALGLITIFIPSLMQSFLIGTIVIAFAAFRLFDVLKPWPISRLERLPRATGIMADDLAAGVAAAMITVPSVAALSYVFPDLGIS